MDHVAWQAKLEAILAHRNQLGQQLSASDLDANQYQSIGKEYAETNEIAQIADDWLQSNKALIGARQMLDDPEIDLELRELAEVEIAELSEKLETLTQEIKIILLPSDEADKRGVILEIRAGTGGDEAALFGADLLRMYQRFASLQGWRTEMLELSENDIGGCQLAIMSIQGQGVYGQLKFESGVHRVQRVPVTESGGRIHTSAATIAILPEAEEVDIAVNETDLRIDTFRSQGAGGQHVNTTDSAVRITHIPSGVVVSCQDEKSQHKNKAKAMKVLRARLYDQARLDLNSERAESRRNMVGSGDRSERIRTYNFPQGRVTDHRINLTLYKLDRIMLGEGLDEIVNALIIEDQAQRLAHEDLS
ncbi:MAG: peptide chain release factor 1 [Alphaproteobacteria bacterium]